MHERTLPCLRKVRDGSYTMMGVFSFAAQLRSSRKDVAKRDLLSRFSRFSLRRASNVECRRNRIDFIMSLRLSSSVECLLKRGLESEIRRSYWQSHGGLETLSECNFYSILFCVWLKLAVLAVLADCLYPQPFGTRDGHGSRIEYAGWL